MSAPQAPAQPAGNSNLRLFWIVWCCFWAAFWLIGGFIFFFVGWFLAWGLAAFSVAAILIPVGSNGSPAGFQSRPPKPFYPHGQPDWIDRAHESFDTWKQSRR